MARTMDQVMAALMGDVLRQLAVQIVATEERDELIASLQKDASEKLNTNGKK